MALSITSSPVTIHCQGILFDMDGILISSLGSVERSWTKWAGMRGVDPEYAIARIHGRRAIDSLRAIRPDLDGEAELRILEQFEVDDTEGLEVLKGVPELLQALPEDRWTVVTSATERLARVRLAAGGLPVPERFVYGEMVAEGKPHPAPYLAGARLLGFKPGECVAFEDSASGIESAHAAGCITIATAYMHAAEDLQLADFLVRDLCAISAFTALDEIVLQLQPLPAAEPGA
jgi:sugar-phosphatase